MSGHDDPLRRAVARGDTACPDGEALARLGELVRAAATPERDADLSARVSERVRADDDAVDADEAGAIDAAYDLRVRPDPTLAKLGTLVRAAASLEREVDLVPALKRRLAGASRRLSIQPPREDARSRWRIVSAVAAAHVAALIVLTLWNGAPNNAPEPGDVAMHEHLADDGLGVGNTEAPTNALPAKLPADWHDLAVRRLDLFLLRRDARARADARTAYAMTGSASAVDSTLAWLQSQQDAATGAIGPLTGQLDRDLAVQSLAALALSGEGGGTTPMDVKRTAALKRSLAWIADHAADHRRVADHDRVVAGLAALALVEGGLLLDDQPTRDAAVAAVADIDAGDGAEPAQSGASGLGGFTLLAVETASIGGLDVPTRARQQAERIARSSLPGEADADPGRLGLAVFARAIYGRADSAGSAKSLARLGEYLPIADAQGEINPLPWFFATLALRETGGEAWTRWVRQLQPTLIEALAVDSEGRMHAPAAQVRYADAAGAAGDVLATALVTLDLQAAYRYLPLAR